MNFKILQSAVIELINDLENAKRISIEKNQRNYTSKIMSTQKGNWIISVLLFIGYVLNFIGLITYYGGISDDTIFLFIFIFLPPLIILLPRAVYYHIRNNIRQKQIISTIQLVIEGHNSLIKDLSQINTLDEILEKFNIIVNIIHNIIPLLEQNKLKIRTIVIKKELSIFLSILTDLRSDLLIRLTEQQESLKSAKSEVESHIKGTTELKQVSEVQRMRLDKQIEQFEELQRVLVKV